MQVHLDDHLQRAIPQPQTAQTAAAPSRGQRHSQSKLQGPLALKQTHVAEKGEKFEKASRKLGNGALLAMLKLVLRSQACVLFILIPVSQEVWNKYLLESKWRHYKRIALSYCLQICFGRSAMKPSFHIKLLQNV